MSWYIMSPPDPWSLFPRSTAGLTFIQSWQSRNISPREIKQMQKSLITYHYRIVFYNMLHTFLFLGLKTNINVVKPINPETTSFPSVCWNVPGQLNTDNSISWTMLSTHRTFYGPDSQPLGALGMVGIPIKNGDDLRWHWHWLHPTMKSGVDIHDKFGRWCSESRTKRRLHVTWKRVVKRSASLSSMFNTAANRSRRLYCWGTEWT